MPNRLLPAVAAGLALLNLPALLGCGDPTALPHLAPFSESSPITDSSNESSPHHAGIVSGRVRWDGPVPAVPTIGSGLFEPVRQVIVWQNHLNPNTPVVGADHGLTDAVVTLRGVPAESAKAWELPPVIVEVRDGQLRVRQGDAVGRPVGFVRRGDTVTVVSRQADRQAVRFRGAAFATLPLPEPYQPLTRRLHTAGLVEVTSGVGSFWMQAYLVVSDHPYLTLTDAAGRFTISGVPAGNYELVVWKPSWKVARHERHPETGVVIRQWYGPPAEVARAVEVRDDTPAEVEIPLSAADFRDP